MKARFLILLCALALPLAALGFSLFSEGLRPDARVETADLQTVSTAPVLDSFFATLPDIGLGLSLQSSGLSLWNVSAGLFALLIILLLRRL